MTGWHIVTCALFGIAAFGAGVTATDMLWRYRVRIGDALQMRHKPPRGRR